VAGAGVTGGGTAEPPVGAGAELAGAEGAAEGAAAGGAEGAGAEPAAGGTVDVAEGALDVAGGTVEVAGGTVVEAGGTVDVAGGTADGAGAPGAAGVEVAGFTNSSTTLLPPTPGVRAFEIAASAKVQIKKVAARPAVMRLSKLADPEAPNKVPEAPLPKAAPMSAPLPCCKSTSTITPSAARACKIKIGV
jgi:hypothetical protein